MVVSKMWEGVLDRLMSLLLLNKTRFFVKWLQLTERWECSIVQDQQVWAFASLLFFHFQLVLASKVKKTESVWTMWTWQGFIDLSHLLLCQSLWILAKAVTTEIVVHGEVGFPYDFIILHHFIDYYHLYCGPSVCISGWGFGVDCKISVDLAKLGERNLGAVFGRIWGFLPVQYRLWA